MQNEKVMIITGGSSGIGRAAALRFANQGDKVLITGRRAGPVEQTVAQHKNIAGTGLSCPLAHRLRLHWRWDDAFWKGSSKTRLDDQ